MSYPYTAVTKRVNVLMRSRGNDIMGLDLGIFILNKLKNNNKTKNSASSRMLLFIICGFVESRILSKSTFQGEICF